MSFNLALAALASWVSTVMIAHPAAPAPAVLLAAIARALTAPTSATLRDLVAAVDAWAVQAMPADHCAPSSGVRSVLLDVAAELDAPRPADGFPLPSPGEATDGARVERWRPVQPAEAQRMVAAINETSSCVCDRRSCDGCQARRALRRELEGAAPALAATVASEPERSGAAFRAGAEAMRDALVKMLDNTAGAARVVAGSPGPEGRGERAADWRGRHDVIVSVADAVRAIKLSERSP